MACHLFAHHLEVPSIALLLVGGFLLGPDVSGVIRPESLGPALDIVVGVSVAVILFEGGLNLNIVRLRNEAVVLRKLVTWGLLITGVGGTLTAVWIMDWDWQAAAPFGAIVVVTGPTVITPLMRRIKVDRNLSTILEGEGVFLDAIGAILAVVVVQIILTTTTREAAFGLLGLPQRLLLGLGLGLAGGMAIGTLLRREWIVPRGLENILTLSLVLVLFEVSEVILEETGIMTVAVAGIVVGNMETRIGDELKEFKEQLTILLIGLLFILLAADIRIADMVALGWPGLLTVGILILIVRPLGVGISTAGSNLSTRQRLFLCWIAPRGIVAAAVASQFADWFAEAGVQGAGQLQALVFLVIAITVMIQGGMAGVVADALGVRRSKEMGYALVGANPVGRALARALRAAGEPVVLVDSSASESQAAERAGLQVVFGNAAEERTLRRAELDLRRGLITVTENEAVNLLVANRAARLFRLPPVAVALNRRYGEVEIGQVHEEGSEVLFGEPVDLEFWNHELLHGSVDISAWEYRGEGPREALPEFTQSGDRSSRSVRLLPLVRSRGGTAGPVTDRCIFRPGDVVYYAYRYRDAAEIGRWLVEHGWRPAVQDETSSDEDENVSGPGP